MAEMQTTADNMRERIRAALSGESDEARAAAVAAVEGTWVRYGGVEGGLMAVDELARVEVFYEACHVFHPYLQEAFLDERFDMSEEEIEALPEIPTRADQWGISVPRREAFEAMVDYWQEFCESKIEPKLKKALVPVIFEQI